MHPCIYREFGLAGKAELCRRAGLDRRVKAAISGRRPRRFPRLRWRACLSTGPSRAAVPRVHEKAGHPADEICELPVEL